VLSALRQAAAAPAYWDYLCKRFTWLQSDLNNIQWHTFQDAPRTFPCNDQCRIVLFTHDKLPLRTSKFHPHVGSTLCPSCRREYEDVWHFFECQQQDQRRLFTQFKQSLHNITVKCSLHPAILTVFWLGLAAIRTDTPYPEIQADLPPILHHIIQQQSRLGWDQLYHGRTSHMWEQAIDQLNPHLLFTGQSIMTQMIKSVWTYFLAVWKLQNQHLQNDAGQLSLPNY